MALTPTIHGQAWILTTALHAKLDADDPLTISLYTNDYNPTVSSNSGDFTEADFDGYTAIELARANWDAATANTPAYATYAAPIVWQSTDDDPQDLYGYFVVNTNGDVVFSERFATTQTIAGGGTFTVNITLGLAGIWYWQ